MQFFTALLSALVLAVSTNATPVHVAERTELMDYEPTVLGPPEGAIWPVGSNQSVIWDTSNIPSGAENNTLLIVLGHFDEADPGSENLDLAHPLAQDIPITKGIQNVTVPDVPYRTTYFVVVFGDSGDRSANITICQ